MHKVVLIRLGLLTQPLDICLLVCIIGIRDDDAEDEEGDDHHHQEEQEQEAVNHVEQEVPCLDIGVTSGCCSALAGCWSVPGFASLVGSVLLGRSELCILTGRAGGCFAGAWQSGIEIQHSLSRSYRRRGIAIIFQICATPWVRHQLQIPNQS